jgi:hypothetical protein
VNAVPGADVASVTLAASVSAMLAAVIVMATYRDGPYPFPPRPF